MEFTEQQIENIQHAATGLALCDKNGESVSHWLYSLEKARLPVLSVDEYQKAILEIADRLGI